MTDLPLRDVPRAVFWICERLRERDKRAWIVGGCVRDMLLGRPIADWDVCTDATPKELLSIFPKAIPTGIEHGTVTVVRDHQHFEVTTLRGEEGYSDGRRPDSVYFTDDIDKDLARRDFTVNAIALDPVTGHVIDPFHGQDDLAKKVLRAVGDPREHELILARRVRRLSVRSPKRLAWAVDGQEFSASRLTARIHSQRLPVVLGSHLETHSSAGSGEPRDGTALVGRLYAADSEPRDFVWDRISGCPSASAIASRHHCSRIRPSSDSLT